MRVTAALLGLVLCFSACEGGCGEAAPAAAPESSGQTVSGNTGGGSSSGSEIPLNPRGEQTFAPAKAETDATRAAAPPAAPAPAPAAASGQATTLAALNPADFDRAVIKSAKPVLVLFVTSSCRPCAQVEFALSGLAPDYAAKVSFARVDLNQAGAMELLPAGLRRLPLPAFAFYQDGTPLNVRQGLPVAGDASTHLKNWLKRVIEGRDVRL
ncbi:MAG: thioredoxin family protein [Elusimicrobiota bacterium]|nr:thioredoxin family protein [Elusimicrobiota bacterium]